MDQFDVQQPTLDDSVRTQASGEFAARRAVICAALAVCAAAANAQERAAATNVEVGRVTLDMCATLAFRNKNERMCNQIELGASPKMSQYTNTPSLGGVPTTSPNYRGTQAVKTENKGSR